MRDREAGRTLEFKAILVYRVSSRTTRTMQKNPVLENKNTDNSVLTDGLFLWVAVLKFLTVRVLGALSLQTQE